MALTVSAQSRLLFLIVTGDEFPDANEDRLRALGEAWEAAGRRLGEELGPALEAAVTKLRATFTGQAAQAFTALMAPFIDGEHSYLTASAGFFGQVSGLLRELALDVEYMKYVVILELAMLDAEATWAMAISVITGPLPLIWLASRSEMTRKAIQNVITWVKRKLHLFLQLARQAHALYTEMPMLARGLLTGITVSMGNQMLVTAGAQAIQFNKGTRTHWNTQYLQDATVVGTIGGALAPLAGLPAAFLAKQPAGTTRQRLKDALEGVFNTPHHATDWHKHLAHSLTHIGGEFLHEGLTATLSTLALTHQFAVNWADFTAGASSGITRTAGHLFGHIINHLTLTIRATVITHKTHWTHENHHHPDIDSLHDTGQHAHRADDNGPYNGSYRGIGLRGGALDDDTSFDNSSIHSDYSHDNDPHPAESHYEPIPIPAAYHQEPATPGPSHPAAHTGNVGITTTSPTRHTPSTDAFPAAPSGQNAGPRATPEAPTRAHTDTATQHQRRDTATLPTTTPTVSPDRIIRTSPQHSGTTETVAGQPMAEAGTGPTGASRNSVRVTSPPPTTLPPEMTLRGGGLSELGDETDDDSTSEVDAMSGDEPVTSREVVAAELAAMRNALSAQQETKVPDPQTYAGLAWGSGKNAVELDPAALKAVARWLTAAVDLDTGDGAQAPHQALEPVAADGFRGFARVVDSLVEDGGAAAMVVGRGTAREQIFPVIRSRGYSYLINLVKKTRVCLTPEEIRTVGTELGDFEAAVFDANGDRVRLADFGWSSSEGGAEALTIHAVFQTSFGAAGLSRRQLAAITPHRFGGLDEVIAVMTTAGQRSAATLTAVSRDGQERALTLVNFDGSVRILTAHRSGIGVVEPTSGVLPRPGSVQAVVTNRFAQVIPGTERSAPAEEKRPTARPTKEIAEVLPHVDGADEAFGFHRERGSGIPASGTLISDGEAGLVELSLQVLFDGRDAYALAAVHLPRDGSRGRMWIVDGSLGRWVTVTEAKTGHAMEWATLREVGAVDVFVPGGRRGENISAETRRRSDGYGQYSRDLHAKAMDEYNRRAKTFEDGLPSYLSEDYRGWPLVVNEWKRFWEILSERVGPEGGARMVPAASRIVGSIDLVRDLSEKTVWTERFPGIPGIPPEVLAGDASRLSYDLLTLAREANKHWDAKLDPSLLRLGLVWYGLSFGLGNYHRIMLGGQLADPERGTRKADPALRYADNLGRYWGLYPIEPRAIRAKLGPFPHEYHTEIIDQEVRAADERGKVTEAAFTDDRLDLMNERADQVIPSVEEFTESRIRALSGLPGEQIRALSPEDRALLRSKLVDAKLANARVRSLSARETLDHRRPSELPRLGNPEDRPPAEADAGPVATHWQRALEPSALPLHALLERPWNEARQAPGWTTEKVTAGAIAADSVYGPDEFNRAYEIVSSREHRDVWPAIPDRHALPVIKLVAAALRHDSKADVKHLVTAIAADLARESLDTELAKKAMVAQAIHDGHDPDEAEEGPPPVEVETHLAPPADHWWRANGMADEFHRFASEARQTQTFDGPLQIPEEPGQGAELMRGVHRLDEIIIFLEFFRKQASQPGSSTLSPVDITRAEVNISAGWPETLSLDMPIAAVPDVLSQRDSPPPPGSTGVVLALPPAQTGPDTVEVPRAWGVVVDRYGPQLVDVRGQQVSWPRSVPDRGHVMVVFWGPDGKLLGVPRPHGLDFARHFHVAFQDAFDVARDRDPGWRRVVVPQDFQPGQAGLDEIVELVENAGIGASAVVNMVSPKSKTHWTSNVVNHGQAQFVDFLERGAPTGETLVSAFVEAPDRTLLAGHEVGSVEVTAQSGRKRLPAVGESLKLGYEFTFSGDAILRRMAFQEETNRFGIPARLSPGGNGIGDIAKLFVRLQFRAKPGDAALLGFRVRDPYGPSRLPKIVHLQGNGAEQRIARRGKRELFSTLLEGPDAGGDTVYLAMLSTIEDVRPFHEWAGANLHATKPRLSIFSPAMSMDAIQNAARNYFGQVRGTDAYQAAYEALLSYPGWRTIAASPFAATAIKAAAYVKARWDRPAQEVFDGIVDHIADDDRSSTPLMREIKHLRAALTFQIGNMRAFAEPGSAAPPDLTKFFPEPFGRGSTALDAVIELVRTGRRDQRGGNGSAGFWAAIDRSIAGRRGGIGDTASDPGDGQVEDADGTSLVVFTLSPAREYEAFVLFKRGSQVILKGASGVTVAARDALGKDSMIYALGTRSDNTIIAGIPRPAPEPAVGDSSTKNVYQPTMRGGEGSLSDLAEYADADSAWEEDSVSDRQTVSDDDSDPSGLIAAVAAESTWYGQPTTPETVDLDVTEGPIVQALSQPPPAPAGTGYQGLARVLESLPANHTAARLAINIGEPTARIVNIFRSPDQTELTDHVQGTRIPITPDNIHYLAATLGDIHATLFDTHQKPIPLIPLTDYQKAVYEKAETDHQLREAAATGREVDLPGTSGRMVTWLGRTYLITKTVLFAELAADLAAALDREIVALVVGADAEDPIRWMVFPPLGRPVPVKPEDLPPDAQAALADLGGPGQA